MKRFICILTVLSVLSLSFTASAENKQLSEQVSEGSEKLGKYLTTENLNIRAEATTESESLGTISKGEIVDVTEIKGIWGKTDFSGVSGYICLTYATYIGDDVSETPTDASTSNSDISSDTSTSNSETPSETPSEPVKKLEIDYFRDITTANVNKIMSSGSYKITDVPSSSLKIPDTIPTELTDKLEKLLDDAPYSCAVYYIDLETGFEITYNADRWFGGASAIKAPFMMALLDKIERGKLSFDKLITYSYDRAGTVQISKDYELGAKLSVRLLIEYLIYYSDNVAFSLLMNNACSLSEFRSYCKKNYGTDIYKDGLNQMNAIAPAKCLQDLYEKAKSGNEMYVWFIELLKQANENKFIRNGLPKDENGKYIYEVAHKYGMDINASNDEAIVFCGERPYVLVVLTDYIGYNTQSFINKVSAAVYDIHKYIIQN